MLISGVLEHVQRDDVFRGVVFDGLNSIFASSYVHTLHSVLKAINNRKYIFVVTLKNDYNTIKQQQKRVQAEKGEYLLYFALPSGSLYFDYMC